MVNYTNTNAEPRIMQTTNAEPRIMQVFLGGCTEIPEFKISVRTPGLTIEKANFDIEITKPKPDPTKTPRSQATIKPTIKPTSFGDEVSYEDAESGTGTFVSVTDERHGGSEYFSETDFNEIANFDGFCDGVHDCAGVWAA